MEMDQAGNFLLGAGSCPQPCELQEDRSLGMLEQRQPSEKQPSPATAAAPKRWELGTLLGRLPQLPRAVIPTVACALLSQQQAAAAAARGVPVAYAEPHGQLSQLAHV